MKNFVRRIAVVIGAAALSAGLIGATAVPAHADRDHPSVISGPRHQLALLSHPTGLRRGPDFPPTCLVPAPTPQARLNSTRAVTAGSLPS